MTNRQARRLREGDQVRHADGQAGRILDNENQKTSEQITVAWDDGIETTFAYDEMESVSLVRGG